MFELETITDRREQRTDPIKHKAVRGRFSVAECLARGSLWFMSNGHEFSGLESGDGGFNTIQQD